MNYIKAIVLSLIFTTAFSNATQQITNSIVQEQQKSSLTDEFTRFLVTPNQFSSITTLIVIGAGLKMFKDGCNTNSKFPALHIVKSFITGSLLVKLGCEALMYNITFTPEKTDSTPEPQNQTVKLETSPVEKI